MAVLGQGRRLAQHRRHDRGGCDGGLGARPPPLSTPPPRQRWWCWRSWGKAAASLNTATLELAAVLSLPGGTTPCNALRKDRPEPPLDGLLVPLSFCAGDDCPQNLEHDGFGWNQPNPSCPVEPRSPIPL